MRNTMDKWEYLKEHIVWGGILFIYGKSLFFRCIPNYTYIETAVILLLVTVCAIGVGICLTWKKGRNYLNLAENIILPWGIFIFLAYRKVYEERVVILGNIMLIISLLMSVVVFLRRSKRVENGKQIIWKKLKIIINLWRRNLLYTSLLLLLPLGASVVFGGTVLNSRVEVAKVYGDEHCLAENIEMIANIEPERWKHLDIQQKLDVCQKIINCEGRYLGLSHEISVGTAELSEGTLAYYNEKRKQVVIAVSHLSESYSYDVLETLIHECTHAYQHEQVELYKRLDEKSRNLLMFYDVSIYMEEFEDYKDGNEDFGAYYSQKAEIDARKAAKTESLEYIKRINEYLDKENVNDDV